MSGALDDADHWQTELLKSNRDLAKLRDQNSVLKKRIEEWEWENQNCLGRLSELEAEATRAQNECERATEARGEAERRLQVGRIGSWGRQSCCGWVVGIG